MALTKKRVESDECNLLWPRRNLSIRKGGVWRDSLAPLFPGYLFVRAETITNEVYAVLRKAPGFYRFLLSNENIVPLVKEDQDLLLHFLSFGEIVNKSVAYFDENHRIRIVSGPLKGLEGNIIRVDRRKGRAKVRLDLYKDAFEVDFGFEAIEAAPNLPK